MVDRFLTLATNGLNYNTSVKDKKTNYWMLILVTIIASGVSYCILQNINNPNPNSNFSIKVNHSNENIETETINYEIGTATYPVGVLGEKTIKKSVTDIMTMYMNDYEEGKNDEGFVCYESVKYLNQEVNSTFTLYKFSVNGICDWQPSRGEDFYDYTFDVKIDKDGKEYKVNT
ncbi:MAG: hypothetical protein NTW98_02040 [Candidatus Nomurabacteria bacterium]|nr:hypothetical protein [Candidatus Nomurabacteria bacterium]